MPSNACKRCGATCRKTYCSHECAQLARRTGRELKCDHCGGTFYVRRAHVKRGDGRFCSVPCRRTWAAAHAKNYLRIGRRYVHRIVMANKLGRPLRVGEVVHHVDGNILNNDPSNLELLDSQAEHMSLEAREGKAGFTHEQAVAAGRRRQAQRRAQATSSLNRSR